MNHVDIVGTCEVCGEPLYDRQARTCSEACRSRKYRAKRREREIALLRLAREVAEAPESR